MNSYHQFRPKFDNEPFKSYGYLCPRCMKRWGSPQRNGYIDITRCESCPPLHRQLQAESNKRLKNLYCNGGPGH